MALPQSKPPAAFRKYVLALLGENYGDKTLVLCPTAFVTLLNGDHKAAILLAQMLYWSDRTKDPDGYFYKSYAEWTTETGLSETQVRRIVNGDPRVQSAQVTLRDLGVETMLKKVKRTGAPTLHYRINQTKFLAALERLKGQGDSQQCEGSIPDKAQDEPPALPGMNTDQCAASSDQDSETSYPETSAGDHDPHHPARHPDEDDDLDIFFSFENRFGLLKQSAKDGLRQELVRLGASRVGEVLERCAIRGRSWQYVVRALANETPALPEGIVQPQEGRSLASDVDEGQTLQIAPVEALLAVSARVQTSWSGGCNADATVDNAWRAAYHQLEAQLDRATFETCLRGAVLVDFEPEISTFVIVVRTAYARDLLQERYDRMISRILGDVVDSSAKVKVLLKEDWLAANETGEAA